MSGFGAFLGGLSGGTIGASIVSLALDSRRFDQGLAGSEAKLKGSTTKMQGGISRFSGAAVAGFALAAVAAIKFASVAVKAASDQAEALNKVEVVFGETSDTVTEFAENTADAFGISETAALSAAGTFGNLFTSVGIAGDEMDDMSVELVGLAADLASFNNIDPTEALDKLRAGLVGEAEPLRTLGIFLSEGRVQAEAYASGIAVAGEELTDAQKVQARYNIILGDSTVAQGDFERTSDSLANSQRRLQAKLADTTAEIGNDLLPVVELLAEALNQITVEGTGTLGVVRELGTDVQDLEANMDALNIPMEEQDRLLQLVKDHTEKLVPIAKDLADSVREQEKWGKLWTEVYAVFPSIMDDVEAGFRRGNQGAFRLRLGIQRLAQAGEQSAEDFRDAVRDSGNFVEASWEELLGQAHVTADGIIRAFRRALRQQAEFHQNTRDFASGVRDEFGRIPPAAREMIADLAQRGPEGAAIMAALADATGNEIRTILGQWKKGEQGPENYLDILDRLETKLQKLDQNEVVIPIRFEFSQTGDDHGIADELADELIRGQTP